MQFEDEYAIIGPMRGSVTIARGHGIRELAQLRAEFGPGQCRTRKGDATVVAKRTGDILEAELHWYEAAGIGKAPDEGEAEVGLDVSVPLIDEPETHEEG